jgi:hypothetical protein
MNKIAAKYLLTHKINAESVKKLLEIDPSLGDSFSLEHIGKSLYDLRKYKKNCALQPELVNEYLNNQ